MDKGPPLSDLPLVLMSEENAAAKPPEPPGQPAVQPTPGTPLRQGVFEAISEDGAIANKRSPALQLFPGSRVEVWVAARWVRVQWNRIRRAECCGFLNPQPINPKLRQLR